MRCICCICLLTTCYLIFFSVNTLLTKKMHLSTNPVQLMYKYELICKSYYGIYLQEQNMAEFYFIKGYYENVKL